MDLTLSRLLEFANVAVSSVLVILAFSLLAYTLTYNIGSKVARIFAMVLACVMVTFASDVALDRVVTGASASRWLHLQWLGIAFMPAASYLFAIAVLETTNFRLGRRRKVAWMIIGVSVASALLATLSTLVVGPVQYQPPISYLTAGPLFWPFAIFYVLAIALALGNVWRARQRCLTDRSRQRLTYLTWAFAAPALGIFPYLIGLSWPARGWQTGNLVLVLAMAVNAVVAMALIVMAYIVAYFGVLTPDRVVRYRLLRFFIRGPVVAIVVILALLTVPKVEGLLGLPRDIVLFSVITGVIVLSQLFLSVTKSQVDRLVYREDTDEIAWLRELDRRLLATSDLRQFLENHLAALCELLRVPSGFVAAVAGPDLVLEVVVGPPPTRQQVTGVEDWPDALGQALRRAQTVQPLSHSGFWVWPLVASNGHTNDGTEILGMLGVKARTDTPLLSQDEVTVLDRMVENVARALMDRQLQQGVFVALQRIIPDIERIQQMRNVVPYDSSDSTETPVEAMLSPSPIHSPEFEAWVKEALSHYWGGPKLTLSPLVRLRVVSDALNQADGNPTKALRLVLGAAIERLRPEGKPNLSTPEWLLYNILEMRFIQGRKVREIADRLAISESDLYRKQRVAIDQVARMLTEMEQGNVVIVGKGEKEALGQATPAAERNGRESVTTRL